MKKKILLDCSSINAGGGAQVSISFLKDLIDNNLSKNYCLYLSLELMKLCENQKIKIYEEFNEVRVRKFPYIVSIFYNSIWYKNFDVVFNIFGPPYFLFKPKKIISGMARAQIFYPDIFWEKDVLARSITKIKALIHKLIYKYRVDIIVVEAKHVKKKCKMFFSKKIIVVGNCLSRNFVSSAKKSKKLKKLKKLKKVKSKFNLLYVGANYSHKNLHILGDAISNASIYLKQPIKLITTLKEKEYYNLPKRLKKISLNLGIISALELKSAYYKSTAVIFPSLLESFSITPIEAMFCKKPLIASDRDFIREFCMKIPYYFNPVRSKSITCAIIKCLMDLKKNSARLNKGRKISEKYNNSLVRTKKYISIINE